MRLMHHYLLYHGGRTKVLKTLSRNTVERKVGFNLRDVVCEKKSVFYRINEIHIIIIRRVRNLEVITGSPLSTPPLQQ